MKDLKIYYEVEEEKEGRIDKEFDDFIELLAKQKGLFFSGSGYNYQDQIRELHYASKK